MELLVEYRFDPESRNWSFTIPSLGIVGGADSCMEAETRAREAVAFTLESTGDGNDGEVASDAELAYVHVLIDS